MRADTPKSFNNALREDSQRTPRELQREDSIGANDDSIFTGNLKMSKNSISESIRRNERTPAHKGTSGIHGTFRQTVGEESSKRISGNNSLAPTPRARGNSKRTSRKINKE